ncbi:MAG: carboxylesterase, partial [Zoogloea sp.]|nr:carboxylesterase [Zoogloea sp.]
GILALSTYLPLAESLRDEADEANQAVPIWMAHGQYDPVIPLDFSRRSADLLVAAGYPLEWTTYPMEHGLCLEEVRDIENWLVRVLAP